MTKERTREEIDELRQAWIKGYLAVFAFTTSDVPEKARERAAKEYPYPKRLRTIRSSLTKIEYRYNNGVIELLAETGLWLRSVVQPDKTYSLRQISNDLILPKLAELIANPYEDD